MSQHTTLRFTAGMRIFILALLFMLSGFSLQAAIETSSSRVSGSAVVTGAAVTAADNKYVYMQANTATWYNVFRLARGVGRVRAGIDHGSLSFVSTDYDYTFHLKIQYQDTTLAVPTTVYRRVRAAYSAGAIGPYQDAGMYEVNSGKIVWIKATIDSIYNNVTSAYVSSVASNMYVEATTEVERYYMLNYTAVPVTGTLFYTAPATAGITDQNEIRVAWNYIDGAEEYDLEWTYVNNIDASNGTLATNALHYDFAHNSTRITTSDQHYNIPLIFDRGWLIFRVRAVGRAYAAPGEWKRVYGKWTNESVNSTPRVDSIPAAHRYQLLTPHDSKKNWQYVSTFAEEGKKKEVVSYYDGSLRNRQTVTKTSTDKKVLVGETFYDFQGRAAVTALPAPVEGIDKELQFYDGFNRVDSASNKTYSRFDFDRDVATCVTSTLGMSTASGASRYYSSSNAEAVSQQAWLPNAEKYPLAQVEYMPDNTGRVRAQSGVGPDHQLGTTHETQYMYAQPFQEELDRLFGSDVGYNKHYNKTVTIDANGQASITYLDQEGRTIATALAGTPPTNLQALTNGATPIFQTAPDTMTVDLLSKTTAAATDTDADNNIISSDGRTLSVNTQLAVVESQNYKFSYSLTGAVFSPACLPSGICYECAYDMSIVIMDQCSTVLIDTSKLVGTFDTSACAGGATFSILPADLQVVLPRGSYTVTKTLTVNDSVMALYFENYLAQNTCVRSEQSFIDSALAHVDTSGCNLQCDTCADNQFTSACEASYQMLLSDVSPNGQYAEYLVSGSPAPSQYPLSVLNESNALPMLDANWRFPQRLDSLTYYTRINKLHYFLADDVTIAQVALTESSPGLYSPPIVSGADIDTVNGTLVVEPQDLANLSDFILYWDPSGSWAKSLVIYHPEYVYYQWCIGNTFGRGSGADTLSSDEYDSLLLSTNTLAAAQALNLVDPLGNANAAINQSNCRDPYFRAAGLGASQFSVAGPDACDYVDNFQGSSGVSIWKLAKVMTSCGTIYGTTVQVDNCLKSTLGVVTLPTDDRQYLTTDDDWIAFRSLYISVKQHFQAVRADKVAMINNGYNGCIGNQQFNAAQAGMYVGTWANCPFTDDHDSLRRQPCGYTYPLYAGKSQRYVSESTLISNIATAWNGNPAALLTSQAAYNAYLITGQCPMAAQLQALLNAINANNKLKASNDSLYHYNEFTYALYDAMVPGTSFVYPKWSGSGTGATLTGTIGGTGASCAGITLTFPASSYTWGGLGTSYLIEGFSQLIGTGANTFSVIAAIDNDLNPATAAVPVVLTGTSGCITVNCTFPDVCEPAMLATETVNLLNLLIAKGTLYTTTGPGDALTTGPTASYFNNTQLRNMLGTGTMYWLKTGANTFRVSDGSALPPSIDITITTLPAGVTSFTGLQITSDTTATLVADNGTPTTVSLRMTWHPVGRPDQITLHLGDCGSPTPTACTGDEFKRRDDLEAMFRALAANSELKANTSLSGYPEFTTLLEAPLGFDNYSWRGNNISGNTLTAYIRSATTADTVCTATLSFPSTPAGGNSWSTVNRITALQADESNMFNGAAYDFIAVAWFTDNTSMQISGTSCWAIRNCGMCIADTGNTYQNFENFSSVTPGFTTTLTHTASCPGTSQYTVTANASVLCGSASITGLDHTNPGAGRYYFTKYISNGSQTLWSKSVYVNAYTAYTFSAWYMDADTAANTHVTLALWAAGTQLTSVQVTDQAGLWKKIEGIYTGRTTAGNITLEIRSTGAGSVNTKLGLDDIAFNTCGCEPLIVVHPSPTYPYHDSCAQHQVNIALLNAHSQYQQYIDSVQAGFEAAYIDHCIGSAVEVFNVNYILNEYHYTLYYYDQGGNLVRTVPPQGVNIVNLDTYGQTIKNDRDARTITPTAAKTFFTAHTLYTTYTYNSLNQLVQQQTPDGGATSFWYDRLGRIVASQNAKQAAMSPHRYSYTKYDAQGRIQEVGELATANSLTAITYSMRQAWLNDVNYPDLLDGGAVSVSNIRYQVTRTYYDATTFATAAARFTTGTQDNLRKRVVSAAIYENYNGTNTAYNSASHYTYDIHGNVKELVQEIPELSGLNDAANNRYQSYKQTRYFYDLVSGKVNEVWYQHNQADMFYYRYDYDADNRVTAAYTSTDNRQWDRDAKYAYYLHGPLARTEIGQNKVQGIDYAYTLHGWIKGVNSNALTASKDMGRDANADGTLGTIINRYVPADQYGYELTYFDTLSRQDYTSITSNGAFATQAGSGLAAGSANLWNGNIRNMVTSIKKFEDPLYGSAPVMGKAFRYDQLNRIMQAQSYTNYTVGTNSWGAGGALSGWKEQFSYDANGNILTLKRNGVTTVNTNMDDLTYHYYSNTNRLEYVDDAVSSANYSSDIDDETSANYKYDAIGNLIYDASEQIDTIRWNVYGKIERIVRKPTSTKSDLEFHYDAMGNRIVKIVKPRNGSVVLNQDNWTYTYYLRDAQGNVLAVYDRDFTTPTTTYTDAISLKENHLYGSSRVGVRAKTQLLSTATYTYSSTATNGSYVGTFSSRTATAAATNAFTHELKYKAYELSNHLGNVLVTVSDARTATNNPAVSPFVIAAFHAVVLSATDYYAFGSPMEGRSFTSVDYRYGFNGKENDPETVGTGEGLQDYGMRIYNPALGKFLSVDPLTGKYAMLTPYQFASNTPIMAIDLDGLEAAVPVTDFSMATLNIKAKDEVVNYIYVQIKGAELVQAYAMSHPEAGITEAFVKQIIWYAITTEVKRTAEVPVLCDNQSGCGICVPTGECTQTVPTQVNVFLSSSPSNQSTEGSSTTPTENAYKSSAEDLAKDIIETKYPIVKVANQFVDTWETGVGLGSGSTEALCEAGGSYTMDFISGISKAAGMTVTWVITPPNSIWENTNEIPMPPALLESGKAQNKARAEVMKRIYVLFGVAPSPQQVAKTDPENIQGTPGVDPTQRDNTRTPAPAPSSSTGN